MRFSDHTLSATTPSELEMDYLPRPRDSVPGIDVPLVEIIPYDFGSYENFPERHGYTRSDGSWDTEQSPDRLASLLQSWLYFGLLAEFFSTPVDVQKFTSCGQDGRAKLVTAASVKDLIKANYSRDNSFWFGGWERGQLNITCLKSAERALNEYRNLDEFPYPVPPIVLSVQLLIQALLIIFADDAYLSPDSRIPDFDSRFLREHMLNLGWCPRQVKQLSEQNVLVTLYYLATLRRRSPHRLNHTECSRDKCIAYNVKGNVYRSRHTKEDCNCSYISIPTKAVKDIIRRGSIPLMSIRRQKNGERTFSVEEAKSSSDYIAISHVWSDGRGNRNANALLDCQVQELENMFLHQPHIVMSRSLKRSVQPFWMDTLCIPVGDDEDALDLKARAINQMAFIYTSARNVFVLDSELRLSRLATSTSLEIYAYVYCSAWMQRCWTFQEGSLAQKCFFWCADGAVNPLNESEYEDVNDFRWETGWGFTVKTIWQILQFFYHEPIQILYHKYMAPSLLFQPSRKKWADPIHEFVLQTLRNRCQGFLEKPKVYHDEQFPEVFAAPRLSVERFIDVWNVISERTTTESEDILTILANLLDLNAYQLQKLPPQLRLKAIVFALGAIPSSLLFISGPRLDVEGVSDDRWIPTSLNGDKLDNFLPHIPIEQDGIYLGSSGMTMILFTRGSHNRYGPFSVNTPDRRLKIVFDLNDASCLDADALAKTAIVYPRRYHKKNFHRDFKGACFFVSNDGYNSRRRGRLIQATFDCSVTLFWAEKDDARLGSNQLERTQEARGRDDADASIKEAEFLSITRSDGYEENDYDNSEDVWELKMSYGGSPSNSLFLGQSRRHRPVVFFRYLPSPMRSQELMMYQTRTTFLWLTLFWSLIQGLPRPS